MSVSLTDVQAVESGVLECARFLAERINGVDGYAEAAANIIPFYLAKNDVDTAAALADAVEIAFNRDQLLIKVVDKCAENDDDEYALQLAGAIDDPIAQEDARERIAIRKAEKFQFEKAFEIAETVDHNSYSLGVIASRLLANGDEERALQTIEKVEDSSVKANYLQDMALHCNENNQTEKALNLLEKAREETKNLDIIEEKVRVLQSIAFSCREIKRNDKSIEILAEAQNLAETLEGIHQNSLLSQISIGFLQSGSIDLADRALDLVSDKTVIAATLTHYADEFYKTGEQAEAVEIIEEAYAILKSQHDRDVRNSREKFSTANSIAVQLASCGETERAIEVALENPADDERFSALARIAYTSATENKTDSARRAISEITDEGKRLEALISLSDAESKKGSSAEALNLLQEVYSQIETVNQMSLRVPMLNELAVRFYKAGETETARRIIRENIKNISKIFDESLKATALASLSTVYEKLEIQPDEAEKNDLLTLLRQPPRF